MPEIIYGILTVRKFSLVWLERGALLRWAGEDTCPYVSRAALSFPSGLAGLLPAGEPESLWLRLRGTLRYGCVPA